MAVALGLVSCSPKKQVKEETPPEEIEEITETTEPEFEESDFEPETIEIIEPDISSGEFEVFPGVGNANFAFDQYNLSYETKEILSQNAQILKQNPDYEVLIEGHCDERGTIEYNIALGQKRADAVRSYYIQLGVPAKQITTLSYGKEKPLCYDTTESCWARNRRTETKLRRI
jgi:peptidoglycan-associated lipoprotein